MGDTVSTLASNESSKPVPDEDKVGRLIQEYKVGTVLGEGAFGVVYACTHLASGTEVAVKMCDKVETPVEKLRREAELLLSLDCPYIVKVHQVFYERCFVCLVMDKFNGGDLIHGMHMHHEEKGKVRSSDAVHVCSQMAKAIRYLHDQSIVHRDVKGDNFLMSDRNFTDPAIHIALCDFGTAVHLEQGKYLSDIVGTKLFWSPEFCERRYRLKVDVWAMGVVVYGLIVGRFPFRDENDIRNHEPHYSKRLEGHCLNYLRGILAKDERERLDAHQCVEHKWLLNASSKTPRNSRRYSKAPEFMPPSARSPSDTNLGVDVVGDEAADASTSAVEFVYGSEGPAYGSEGPAYGSEGNLYGSEGNLYSSEGPWSSEGGQEALSSATRTLRFDDVAEDVVERRRELIKRLNQEQRGKPARKEKDKSPQHYWAKWFMISDKRQAGDTMKFEWLDEGKIDSLGILKIEGMAKSEAHFNDHNDTSPELVGMMLKDHNIDISAFGKGKAKSLLQLAGDVQTGTARLMLDATEHKKLVRVVDVVALRIHPKHDREVVLVETAERFPDGRERAIKRLPGTMRQPYENSRDAAQRIVQDKLGMGDCKVSLDFTNEEVVEEKTESPSYPGVDTVYRKVIVEGVVSSRKKEVLARIGLPHGLDWSCADTENSTRFFEWMTEELAESQNVKLRADGFEDVSGLVLPPIGHKENELPEYLENHNVDPSEYGENNTKTLKEFSNELIKGECHLELTPEGTLIRVVDLVLLKIVNLATGDILVNTEQKARDGSKVSIVNALPGAKRRPDENQFVTARRLMRKQLKMLDNDYSFDAENVQYFEEKTAPRLYPGIPSFYSKRLITAFLLQD